MDFVRIGLFRDHAQYRTNFVQYPPENSEGVIITHWARNPIAAELKARRCNLFYANNGHRPNLFFMRNKPMIADLEGYFKSDETKDPEKFIGTPVIQKVIAQTQWAYDDAMKLIKNEKTRDKIEVVNHAWRTDVERNKNRPDDEVRFFFLGDVFFLKGADWIVEAFTQLYEKYDNIRVTIVASNFTWWSINRLQSYDKPHLGELKNPAWGPGWQKKLDHPGINFIQRHMGYDEKLEYYANSDVFVFPSKWETYGCVLLEAMAYSLPIITTNFGPLPEIVRENKNAFLLKTQGEDWFEMMRDTPLRTKLINQLKDYMEQLILSKSLREKMGRESRKLMMKKYTIEMRNKIMRRIYDDVIE